MSRDTLVWLADEPPRSNPESKAAYSQTALWLDGDGVRGGVCRFAPPIADAGVCARARAAVRVRVCVIPGTQSFVDSQRWASSPVLINVKTHKFLLQKASSKNLTVQIRKIFNS
jgi:hypothetical protein